MLIFVRKESYCYPGVSLDDCQGEGFNDQGDECQALEMKMIMVHSKDLNIYSESLNCHLQREEFEMKLGR